AGFICAAIAAFSTWTYVQAPLASKWEDELSLASLSSSSGYAYGLGGIDHPWWVYASFGLLLILTVAMASRPRLPRRLAGASAIPAAALTVFAVLQSASAIELEYPFGVYRLERSQPGLTLTYASGTWWAIAAAILLGVGTAALGCVDRARTRQNDEALLAGLSGYTG
ncbi:hypothetical protein, partial [Streptomyces sp. NPDC006739]|uniref:hypothetical protein n=1 Tax=Streptomyces sp. NPDC006739 TaxID=3364763 RepID=UPI0036CC9D39